MNTPHPSLAVTVVSLFGESYQAEARLVVLSGAEGELGILAGHAALLTSLRPGNLRVERCDGPIDLIYLTGGLAEIQPTTVTILADVAFRSSHADAQAAARARELTQEMRASGWASPELDLAQRLLAQQLTGIQLPRSPRRFS